MTYNTHLVYTYTGTITFSQMYIENLFLGSNHWPQLMRSDTVYCNTAKR